MTDDERKQAILTLKAAAALVAAEQDDLAVKTCEKAIDALRYRTKTLWEDDDSGPGQVDYSPELRAAVSGAMVGSGKNAEFVTSHRLEQDFGDADIDNLAAAERAKQ